MHRQSSTFWVRPFSGISLIGTVIFLLTTDAMAVLGPCSSQPGLPSGAPALTPGSWLNISPSGVPFGPSPTTFSQGIAIDPCNPAILYVSVDGFDTNASKAGLYKSTNAGGTWTKIGPLDEPVHIRINPMDTDHLVVADGVRGATQGIWVSHDGGMTWAHPSGWTAAVANKANEDVYDVAVDPSNFNHMLVTFHSGWGGAWGVDSGVLETRDGGANWITHSPRMGWGTGHGVWFISSDRWLLGTQGAGYWLTEDSGANWQQVSTGNMQHGGGQLYKSRTTGELFITTTKVLRNRDGSGRSWEEIGPTQISGINTGIIGDGQKLYVGPYWDGPFYIATESDPTAWTAFNTQTFLQGPFELAYDSVNGIVYSASWQAGVLALKVGVNTPSTRCDVNADSVTNVSDVQLCVNQAIRISNCSTGDVNGDNRCDVTDVQRVANAVLGESCN
jgi:hypothetical protein